MITAAQCRAARGLLAWTQYDLADRAGIGIVTVHQFEAGLSQPRRATGEVIKRAFEQAGVAFIDDNGGGPGVRLLKQGAKSRIRPCGSRQSIEDRGGRIPRGIAREVPPNTFVTSSLLNRFKLAFEFGQPSSIWVLNAETEKRFYTGPLLALRWGQFGRFRRQVLCCPGELGAAV